MTRSRRVWIPVLVGLLVAGLSGVGGGGAVAVEPRLTTAAIIVPPSAFTPTRNDAGPWYQNDGNGVFMFNGEAQFVAPLSFPVPVVNIKRVTLYAWDGSAEAAVCLQLLRTTPRSGLTSLEVQSVVEAGAVCTDGAQELTQEAYTVDITPRRVNQRLHNAYLKVDLMIPPGVGALTFYGVKVTYTYETGT